MGITPEVAALIEQARQFMEDWDTALAMDKARQEAKDKRNLHRRLQTYAKRPQQKNAQAWAKGRTAGQQAAIILGKG